MIFNEIKTKSKKKLKFIIIKITIKYKSILENYLDNIKKQFK